MFLDIFIKMYQDLAEKKNRLAFILGANETKCDVVFLPIITLMHLLVFVQSLSLFLQFSHSKRVFFSLF